MKYKIVVIFLVVIIFSAGYTTYYSSQNTDEDNTELKIFRETRSLMDTTVTIQIRNENKNHAIEAIDKAFDKMIQTENLMSAYDENSQLYKLNDDGYLKNANPELVHVIKKSKHYYNISNGAFDITVKPIIDLWESKFAPEGPHKPPTDEEINEALKLVNISNITIKDTNLYMKEDMRITLGGIAKGYVVDKAIESLRKSGIEHGFVNAGGDGRYIGYRKDNDGWRIGLQNPNKSGAYITKMNLHNMSVATSGNYERYYNDSIDASHIVDPRNGKSTSKIISSTVIAKSAMDADAYSTAVFVLGKEKGLEMVEKLDDVECLIITSNRSIIRSSEFNEYENE